MHIPQALLPYEPPNPRHCYPTNPRHCYPTNPPTAHTPGIPYEPPNCALCNGTKDPSWQACARARCLLPAPPYVLPACLLCIGVSSGLGFRFFCFTLNVSYNGGELLFGHHTDSLSLSHDSDFHVLCPRIYNF